MRDAVVAAIGLPLLLAGARVERQQVGVRHVVAQQDQEIAVQRGRAAVSPSRLERRVLRCRGAASRRRAPPYRAPEPGRCRTRRRRAGHRSAASGWPGCASRGARAAVQWLRFDTPIAAGRWTVGTPRRRATPCSPAPLSAPSGFARAPPIGRSCSASARSSRASRGCASPPASAALPTCDVTKTRSAHTMGEEVPSPASGARQAMFSFALHVVGQVRLGRHAEARRPSPLRPVLGRGLRRRLDEPRRKRHARDAVDARLRRATVSSSSSLRPETVPSVLCAKRTP